MVSCLSVFGVPMQGARFFWGEEGIHEKFDQHKTMPSNHVFDVDQVFFWLVIRLEVGILRLKSSIDCRSVGSKACVKLLGFFGSFRWQAATDLSRYISTVIPMDFLRFGRVVKLHRFVYLEMPIFFRPLAFAPFCTQMKIRHLGG